MLDLHILAAIQTGWKSLSADLTSWREILAPYVDSTLADQWHGQLFPSGDKTHLRFTAAYAPSVADIPSVSTRLEEEPLETGLLGAGYTEEVEGGVLKSYYVIHTRSTVTISIHTESNELLRCLHTVIRALVMSSLQWLVGLGYDSLDYQGGGDVMPQQDMLPEGQGVYMREMRWNAISQHQVEIGNVSTKPAFIYLKETGLTIGSTGSEGGVEPLTSS